jgi:hypothetical protein
MGSMVGTHCWVTIGSITVIVGTDFCRNNVTSDHKIGKTVLGDFWKKMLRKNYLAHVNARMAQEEG